MLACIITGYTPLSVGVVKVCVPPAVVIKLKQINLFHVSTKYLCRSKLNNNALFSLARTPLKATTTYCSSYNHEEEHPARAVVIDPGDGR